MAAVGSRASLAALRPEVGDGGLELLGLGGEFLGGGRDLLGRRRVLLRHLVELLQRLVDLGRADVLLAAGRADLLDQLRRAADVGNELGEHLARLARRLHRVARQRRDLGCRRLAALGELAHLRGDHREAAAMLAGARRFHRGVERQQVGLAGDLLHDGDLGDDGLHRLHRALDGLVGVSASWAERRAIFSVWEAFSAFCFTLAAISSIEAEACSVAAACSVAP